MKRSKETSLANGHYDKALFRRDQHLKSGWFNVYIEPASYEIGHLWKTRGQANESKSGSVAYRIRVKLKGAEA